MLFTAAYPDMLPLTTAVLLLLLLLRHPRPLKSATASETKVAIMLFNPSEATASVTATWAQVGLPAGKPATVLDLWSKVRTEGMQVLTAEVPPHGGVMVVATSA